jgi:hypothetical protein
MEHIDQAFAQRWGCSEVEVVAQADDGAAAERN